MEAESIAYVVLSHYQMDTSDYSIPYLASWSRSQDTAALRASMDTIRKAASEIFDEVEAYIVQRDVDRYTIYQIGEDTPARDYSFMDLEHIKEQGHTVSIAYYQDVYRGYLRPDDSLESLYTRFNMDDRPAADRMHSLSVSDVVVLHKSGEDRAYYVDSVGFKEIPEFFLSPPEQEPAGRDVSEKTELPDQVASEQGSERAAPEKPKTEDQASHNAEEEPTEKDGQEKALSFYAAENMDFPVMGQYRDGLTLALAAEVYQNLPPGRMEGGKGIGCTIHDEKGDPINIRLVTDGRIQEDSLKGLEQHREYPALKAALQEAKTYFPDQSFPTKHVDQRTAAVPVPSPRKESVLAALREHQKNIGKPGPDHKERNLTPQQRKKGELSL